MSRVISTSLPNDTQTVNEYDDDNRLSGMVTTSAKDGVLASFAYTYDAVGNKLTMIEEDGGVTSYQYDAAYRLIHVDYPQRSGQLVVKNNGTTQGKGKKNGHKKAEEPLPGSVSYAYDAAGNRTSHTADDKTVNYRYNAANQLLQMGSTRYSYDANGNRISQQDQEGQSRYQYNQDNFLTGFDDPEGQTTSYGYDAMNRRVYKTAGENDITSYLNDGLEVIQEIGGENSQKIVAYYRANGRILTRQEYNVSQSQSGYQHRPDGRELFYAYDGLGSVVALSNHQGKQKTRYHYDAFGKVIDGDITENKYTFTGRQLDPESGLYHFHFRQYDAQAGAWTTPDPIGVMGGVNLYGYVSNDPVNFRDFLGLSEVSDVNGGFADNGGLGYNGGKDFDSEEEGTSIALGTVAVANPSALSWGDIGRALGKIGTAIGTAITGPVAAAATIAAAIIGWPSEISYEPGDIVSKLPSGSKPINKTPWSGDHQKIKEGVGAKPDDDVFIDRDDNVWVEQPDGSYENGGQAGDYTGSGEPSGQRGKDREKRIKKC